MAYVEEGADNGLRALRCDGSGFDGLRWATLVNGIRVKVGSRHAAGSEHGMGLARHSGHYGALGTNPHTVFEGDGLRHEIEGGLRVIVVSAKQQSALGDAHVAADDHAVEVVDPSLFPNPNMVAHFQFPWVFDGHPRLDDSAAADARSEYPQQSDLQSRRPRKPSLEEEAADHHPEHATHHIPGVVTGIIEQVEARGDLVWHQVKGRSL